MLLRQEKRRVYGQLGEVQGLSWALVFIFNGVPEFRLTEVWSSGTRNEVQASSVQSRIFFWAAVQPDCLNIRSVPGRC